MTTVGSGKYTYELIQDWPKRLPERLWVLSAPWLLIHETGFTHFSVRTLR